MAKREYSTGLLTDGRRIVIRELPLQNGEIYIDAYIETKENYKDFETFWTKALLDQQKSFKLSAEAGWNGVSRGQHVFQSWNMTYTSYFLFHNRCLFTEESAYKPTNDIYDDNNVESDNSSTFHHPV